jgi:hypothetical protein
MLEQNKGFNLGKIGVDLMRNITDEVRDKARQQEITEVGPTSVPALNSVKKSSFTFVTFYALTIPCH